MRGLALNAQLLAILSPSLLSERSVARGLLGLNVSALVSRCARRLLTLASMASLRPTLRRLASLLGVEALSLLFLALPELLTLALLALLGLLSLVHGLELGLDLRELLASIML